MTKMSEEVKNCVAQIRPSLIATCSKAGKPNVSPKGSFRVLDDEHVVFAEIRSPRTIANLKENPQVVAIVFDPATRKGCRIWGKAEILTSGALFDETSKELAARNMQINHVVKVAVEESEAF